MIVASILVGGQEFVANTLIEGFTVTQDIGDRIGTCELTLIGVAASLTPVLSAGVSVQIFTGSAGTGAPFGGSLFGQAVFGGSTPGARLFSGLLMSVDAEAVTLAEAGTGYTKFHLVARDKSYLLETAIVTTATDFEDEADSDIVEQLFASYLPSITVNASTVAVIDSLHQENSSLRQALDDISDLTGAVSYLDPNEMLRYHSPGANPAPFAIAEAPDTDVVVAQKDGFQFTQDFSTIANRVIVIGALQAGGTAIKETVNDAGSQGAYGLHVRTIVDRNIQTSEQAIARGNVELGRYAQPLSTGTLAVRTDGLRVGQLLDITTPAMGCSGSYLIRRVTMTWDTQSDTKYEIEFGDYRPDLYRMIRRLRALAEQKPYDPIAIPAPGTVSPVSFASTIQPVHIVNSLPTLPDANYPNDSVVILTTDHKLYRNAAGTWTAAVPTVDLTGTITSTQIADDSISTPKLQALAITAEKIAANAVVAGKIAADAVVAGTIAAGAIRASDAAFEAAAIQSADINTLVADKITAGTITASISITAGTFTGSTMVLNLNGTTTSINNQSNGSFVLGIKVLDNASSVYTALTSQYLVIYTAAGLRVWSGTNAGAGFISLFDSSGNSTVHANLNGVDLSNGAVYKVGGTPVIDSSRNASFVSVTTTGAHDTSGVSAGYSVGGTSIVNSSRDAYFNSVSVPSATAKVWIRSQSSAGRIEVYDSGGNFGTLVASTEVSVYHSGGSNLGATVSRGYVQARDTSGLVRAEMQATGIFPGSFVCYDGSGNGQVLLYGGSSSPYLQLGANQVVTVRQTDPGAPSFGSVGDAQTWCGNLRTALRNHGLI